MLALQTLLGALAASQVALALGDPTCIYFPEKHHLTPPSLLDTFTSSAKTAYQAILGRRSVVDVEEDRPFIISSYDKKTHHRVSPPIIIDGGDDEAIHIAAHFFARDIERVTGLRPEIYNDTAPKGTESAIVIGSVDSGLVKAQEPKWTGEMRGRWEVWDARVVRGKEIKGVKEALMLTGSDRVSR